MTRAAIIRVACWIIVFAAPVASLGRPMPILILALVPVLATFDGSSTPRVIRWAVLALMFEFVFRIQPGTLSGAILLLALMQEGIHRAVRLDAHVFGTGDAGRALRGIAHWAFWVGGLAMTSVMLTWLIRGMSILPAQLIVYWMTPMTGGVLVVFSLLFALGVLFAPLQVHRDLAW